jgi:hypothetical protein
VGRLSDEVHRAMAEGGDYEGPAARRPAKARRAGEQGQLAQAAAGRRRGHLSKAAAAAEEARRERDRHQLAVRKAAALAGLLAATASHLDELAALADATG